MRQLLVVTVAVMALVAGACGGSDDGAVESTPSVEVDTTAEASPSVQVTPTPPAIPDLRGRPDIDSRADPHVDA